MDSKVLTASRLSRLLIAALSAVGCGECRGQDVTLDLSSAAGKPGFRVILSLTLGNAGGEAPASIQWTLEYSNVDFTALTVSPGPAARNKLLSCSQEPGIAKCILWGENSTSILNGIVADVSLTVSHSARDTSSLIRVSGGQAADAHGVSLPMATKSGTVTIVQPGLGEAASRVGPAKWLEVAYGRVRPMAAPGDGGRAGAAGRPLGEVSPPGDRAPPVIAKAFRFAAFQRTPDRAKRAVSSVSRHGAMEDFGVTANSLVPGFARRRRGRAALSAGDLQTSEAAPSGWAPVDEVRAATARAQLPAWIGVSWIAVCRAVAAGAA